MFIKKSILFISLLLCTPALFCADLPPDPLDPLQSIELQPLEKWVQEKVRDEQYATRRSCKRRQVGFVGLKMSLWKLASRWTQYT